MQSALLRLFRTQLPGRQYKLLVTKQLKDQAFLLWRLRTETEQYKTCRQGNCVCWNNSFTHFQTPQGVISSLRLLLSFQFYPLTYITFLFSDVTPSTCLPLGSDHFTGIIWSTQGHIVYMKRQSGPHDMCHWICTLLRHTERSHTYLLYCLQPSIEAIHVRNCSPVHPF